MVLIVSDRQLSNLNCKIDLKLEVLGRYAEDLGSG